MSEDKTISIPNWFVRAAAAVSALFISVALPWMTWVSFTLIEMNVRLEMTQHNRQSLDHLTLLLNEHLSDPTIHSAGIGRLRDEVDRIHQDVKNLEAQRP